MTVAMHCAGLAESSWPCPLRCIWLPVPVAARRFILAVDTFGTKPLFYGSVPAERAAVPVENPEDLGPVFGAASYRSALHGVIGQGHVSSCWDPFPHPGFSSGVPEFQ